MWGSIFFLFFVSFFLPLSSKAVNNIFYIGLAVPTFFWMLRHARDLPVIFRSHSVLMVLLLGFLVLSAIADVSSIKRILYVLLFFFACLLLARKDGARTVYFAYSAIACLIFLYLIVGWLWQYRVSGMWGRQVFWGSASNPVYASLLILSALVFVWLFYIEGFLLSRSRWQLFAGMFLLMCACLLCVLVFQARSALLGALLFFMAYLIQRRLIFLGAILVLVACGLTYFSGIGSLLLERGVSYRVVIWEDALHHLVNSCFVWLGCGVDEYKFLGQFMHPHSGFVSTLYRFGVVGGALFSVFAMVFFWQGWKSRSPWFLLALIGWGGLLTTGNGFFSSPQPLWVYFWFPTFMTLLDIASSKSGECIGSGRHAAVV